MIWPFGDGPVGNWLTRRQAMRDMRRMIATDADSIALDEQNPLARAKMSVDAGDPKRAREYLAMARERMPAFVASDPATVDVLIGLGDYDEAESFTLEGAKRSPYRPHYLEGYAQIAERRHDMEEAVRRWRAVAKKFPRRKWAFIRETECLCALRRLDEADVAVRRALRLFRDDIGLLICAGRIGDARGDWAAAAKRWDSIRDRHPLGLVGSAHALHKLGRTDEAMTLLAEGRIRYPLERDLPAMQARIAEEVGDTAQALKLWATIRDRFPKDWMGYVEGARCLREQGQWPEADAVAEAAIERFPGQRWPLAEHAKLAEHGRNWPAAASRWAALRAAFPDDQEAQVREAAALTAARQ